MNRTTNDKTNDKKQPAPVPLTPQPFTPIETEKAVLENVTAALLHGLMLHPPTTLAAYSEAVSGLYKLWLEVYGPDYMKVVYRMQVEGIEGVVYWGDRDRLARGAPGGTAGKKTADRSAHARHRHP